MVGRVAPPVLQQAKTTNPTLTIVDVRSLGEYTAGHIADAVNPPLDQPEVRLAQLPTDQPVVTYCRMKHRGSSRGERAADLLRAKGFDAAVLEGGLPAWEAAGLPTMCQDRA